MSKQSYAKSVTDAEPVASRGDLTPQTIHTLGTAADELSALLHSAAGCRTGGREVEAQAFLKAARERLGAIGAVLPPQAPLGALGALQSTRRSHKAKTSSAVASETGEHG